MIEQVLDLANELEAEAFGDGEALLNPEIEAPPGRLLHEMLPHVTKASRVIWRQCEGRRIEEEISRMEVVVALHAVGEPVEGSEVDIETGRIGSSRVERRDPPTSLEVVNAGGPPAGDGQNRVSSLCRTGACPKGMSAYQMVVQRIWGYGSFPSTANAGTGNRPKSRPLFELVS
jgi:hypothetical protein